MKNISLNKKLLFFGLILGSLSQSNIVLSAEVENIPEVELAESYAIDIASDLEDLENSLYLPQNCAIYPLERISKDKAIEILKFLCTFQKNLKQRSPFMESEQLIFDQSLLADKKVQKYFQRGLSIVLATSIISFVGFVSLAPGVDPVVAICLISAASAVVTAIGQYIAFIATGNIPDEASQKANIKQNKFNELKEVYIRLSRVWIDVYFSDQKELAKDIANKMNNVLDNLITIVKDKAGYDHADILLCPIKETIHYILHPQDEKLGISPIIEDYILNKELRELDLVV